MSWCYQKKTRPGGLTPEDVHLGQDFVGIRDHRCKADQLGRGSWFVSHAVEGVVGPVHLVTEFMGG